MAGAVWGVEAVKEDIGTTTTATSGEGATGDQRAETADKYSVTDHGILCDQYGRRPATAAEQWAFREVYRLRAALRQIICVADDNANAQHIEMAVPFIREVAASALEGK